MKASELKTKSITELQKLLVETRVELVNNQRSLAAGELPNPRVVGNNRRDIARIHTSLSQALKSESAKGEDA